MRTSHVTQVCVRYPTLRITRAVSLTRPCASAQIPVRGTGMQYRVVEVRDVQGVRVIGEPTLIQAADDAAAITVVERFLNGTELQVWQDRRLVVILKPAGAGYDRSSAG
jgi:hypothetical protein